MITFLTMVKKVIDLHGNNKMWSLIFQGVLLDVQIFESRLAYSISQS
jgi:hypothetical protein